MKQYTFELVINEGCNEGWEEMLENGNTGCDELLEQVKAALAEYGFEPDIKLVKYEDK
jgi:predicted metal-binding protein